MCLWIWHGSWLVSRSSVLGREQTHLPPRHFNRTDKNRRLPKRLFERPSTHFTYSTCGFMHLPPNKSEVSKRRPFRAPIALANSRYNNICYKGYDVFGAICLFVSLNRLHRAVDLRRYLPLLFQLPTHRDSHPPVFHSPLRLLLLLLLRSVILPGAFCSAVIPVAFTYVHISHFMSVTPSKCTTSPQNTIECWASLSLHLSCSIPSPSFGGFPLC